MKNKATLTLKLTSVLLALAMLLSVFAVSAAGTNGYYKTIASLDYEEVNTNIAKKDNATITTLSNGSTGYLYANPHTTGPVGADIPVTGIEQNKTYTYKLDFYVIEYSNDANGCLIAPFVSGNNGYESQAWLGKDKYGLNQWHTYSTTFTPTKSYTQFKSTIHTYGEAAIIYDNLRILDENGNVVFSEDFEEEKHTLPEGYSYIHDYSNGSVVAEDKVLRLTNDTTGVPFSTLGEFPLGVEGTETTYTLSYDYLIKRKSTGSLDFAFKYDSYCAECNGAPDFGHKPYGDKEHYIGGGKEINKWYNDTLTIKFSDICNNTYAEIHLFQNADVLFDNIVVKDSEGNIVKKFDMNSGTVTGKIGRGDFGGTIEFPVKNELIWLKGAPDVVDGHLYVDATELRAENKDVPVYFNISENIASTEYPYVNFRYRLLEGTTLKSGTMLAIALGGYDNGAVQWFSIPENYTAGEWIEVKEKNFGNVSYNAGEVHMNVHVYSGVEIEIDDIEIHRNQNSGGTILANVNFADNGRFTEASEVAIVHTPKDYAVLVDNSANTGTGQLYMHEVGMPYDGKTYPAGNYTISFDFYTVSIGESNIFPMQFTKPDWNGDCMSQKWVTLSGNTGVWETVTFDITTNTDGKFPWFYVGAGIKGYLDNFKIVDKTNSKTLLEVPFTEADLGKTSKTINTVVDLPADIAFKTNRNYGVLVDNSANTGFGELYMHEVGMPHDKTYPIGDYTFAFDFYALEIGPTLDVVANFSQPKWAGNAFPGNQGQKWLKIADKIGEWQTVSFDITTIADGQYPWFYIGAGIKGYFDNFRIIDKTNNTTLIDTTFTKADLGKTSKNINTVVELPETLFENNVTTVEGDTYTISFIKDSEGIKTYGSNGVLHIATNNWMGYTFSKETIGADILAGKKYRLSFDYNILTPGTDTTQWSIAVVKVKTDKEGDQNDYVTTAKPVSGSKSYEFIATGNNNAYLAINVGCEVVIDNIVLEEFVNYPTLGVQKRGSDETVSALAYGMQLKAENGAEYIYDINGNAIEVAEKGFIAVLTSHINGDLTLETADANPFASIVEVSEVAETVEFAGASHNVYTLAITDPELERSISVRPYVLDAEGNAYYGEATVSSANDLADCGFNAWIGAAIN